MPFTFSHPFIILPFCRKKSRYFSMTALVAGSMSLDFEYFIYMKKLDHDSYHTLRGIFIFGLPAGLLLTFIYHLFIRNAFIDSLPDFWWRRLERYKQFDWTGYCRGHYVVVGSSLLIGVLSHLFLDAFTHQAGIFVKWIPLLQERLHWRGEKVAVFNLLQVLLSVVGAVVIYLTLAWMPADEDLPRKKGIDARYWLIFLLFFCSIMLIRFVADQKHNQPVDILMATIASALMAGFFASVVVDRLPPATG